MPTRLADPYQLPHQFSRLTSQVVLIGLAHRLTDNTRQHRRTTIQRHVALAAPHDVFGLVAEPAQLRPHAFGLVPDSDAAPGEAGDLQRVSGQRQLPPVGEQ